jgi:hypothetical protein
MQALAAMRYAPFELDICRQIGYTSGLVVCSRDAAMRGRTWKDSDRPLAARTDAKGQRIIASDWLLSLSAPPITPPITPHCACRRLCYRDAQ